MIVKFKKIGILVNEDYINYKYLFMYRRKYNQLDSNSLYDKRSEEVNLVQSGEKKMIEKYSFIFDNLLSNDCIIIPMVSEYASKDTFLNLSKLVSEICSKKDERLDGSKLITRKYYLDYIKDFYKEKFSIDKLIIREDIDIVKGRKVIILTDVINNNLNGYLSYRSVIRKYAPLSLKLIGLSRYVES